MARLTQQDLHVLNTTVRHLYAHGDLDTFPARSLALLSRAVPAHIFAYNEVNLRRKRIIAVMDPPAVTFNDQLWSRHMGEHPLVDYYQRTGDGRATKLSDFLTRRQFHRLGLYHEVYRQMDVEHQMSITLAPQPLLIALTLNRSRRDFTERDRLVLNLLRPHLIQAYHNAQAATRFRQESVQLKQALEECSQGIIILTSQGHVRLMTDRARQWLQDYYGQSARSQTRRLPDHLWRWVCQQQSILAVNDTVPPPRTPLVVERAGKRLSVRLLTNQAEGHLLLLLEEQQARFVLTVLAPLGLTKRESEMLYWVAQGKTNKEVAAILGLSPHTVRTRLEDIYRQLGVETRTAAITKALETLGLLRW